MKHAIAKLEWLIYENMEDRHIVIGTEVFGPPGKRVIHATRRLDPKAATRIRSYVLALRVLRRYEAEVPMCAHGRPHPAVCPWCNGINDARSQP